MIERVVASDAARALIARLRLWIDDEALALRAQALPRSH